MLFVVVVEGNLGPRYCLILCTRVAEYLKFVTLCIKSGKAEQVSLLILQVAIVRMDASREREACQVGRVSVTKF